ncbi:hypothetical protein ACFX1T_038947 [Malus domestica]
MEAEVIGRSESEGGPMGFCQIFWRGLMQKATIYAPILGLTFALVAFSSVSDYVDPVFLFILVHGIVHTAFNWWRLDNLGKTNRSLKGVLEVEEGEEGEEEEVVVEEEEVEEEDIGGSVIGYVLNYRTGKATITFDDQKATKASFFQYELESDEAENARGYSYYTSKACHSSILRPRLFTCHVEEKHVFLFYEEFSYKFEDWNMEEHMASEEERISWWKKSIKRILKTILYIHNKGLVHKGLAYRSSYVIQDGELKLVNIRGSLEKLEPLQSQKMKTSDLTDFMTFLRENVPANWTDRNLFLDYIANDTSWSDRVAKKLIRHPFLMDTPHERLRYFNDVFQATKSNTCVNPTAFKKTLDQDPRFKQYKNWTTTYKGHTLYTNFSRDHMKGKYSGQKLFSLIAFLRHVYIHCVTKSAKSADFEKIDEEIAQLCPGLSSRVHEIFVMKDEFFIS